MYDIIPLITLINVNSGIVALISSNTMTAVTPAKEKVPVLTEGAARVTLGYYDLNSQSPTEPLANNKFNQAAENLIQGFDLQIDCNSLDLPVVWRALHKAIIGQNTQPLEEEFSGLTYGTGGLIGLSQGRIHWLDRWRVDFPTINLF